MTDVSTIEPIVVRSPLGWEPLPPRPRRRVNRWALAAAGAAFLFATMVAAFLVPVQYFLFAPGTAEPISQLVAVPDGLRFEPDGEVFLATVSLASDVRVIDALVGWLDPSIDVVKKSDLIGDSTQEEFNRQNRASIVLSKEFASVVALRRLGCDVPQVDGGAFVAFVQAGGPSSRHVRLGEVITAVDGVPVTTADQVVAATRAHRPGEQIVLEIDRADGQPRKDVRVTVGRRPPPKPGEAPPEPPPGPDNGGYLGLALETMPEFTLPIDVQIDSGTIGGPSAGLAFTLGLLDVLTEGELTGGKKVAATGTIDLAGTVGEVGGVAQKTAAVREAGADIFLVPPGEFEAARAHGGDLDVISVTTLDQALEALASRGGGLPATFGCPAPR